MDLNYFDRLPIGVAIFDSTAQLVECNQPFTELLKIAGVNLKSGATYEAMLEAILQVSDYKPDQQVAFVQQRVAAFAAAQSNDYQIASRGEWAFCFNCEFCDDESAILSVTDISEFAHKEALFADAELMSRSGVWELDMASGQISFSDGAWAVFGPGSQEMMGDLNKWAEFVHPDDRERFVTAVTHSLTTFQPYDLAYRVYRSDGELMHIAAKGKVVFDKHGNPRWGRGLFQDITERKLLEEQFRQSQKMEAIGQLTAGVAHDFNNLLTAINGFAGLMQLKLSPDDPQQESLDKILYAADRAADLVRQLLAFSRKQVIEPKVLDLNNTVYELDKMLRRVIGEDIRLKTKLTPDLWKIKFDQSQIEQVIVNLAVNARDAMPEGGWLTIETANVLLDDDYVTRHLETQSGEYILLAISDTGQGMNKEVKAHIFEPFFTTKEPGKGTGLGLATVYGIVKQNGGHIWVYSEPGAGTTFKIYLPRTTDKSSSPTHVVAEREMPSGNETILLVEDDTEVRDLVQEVLRARGYTLLEAEGGQEALQLATEHRGPIHLLLTDVIMPGMSGKLLAEKITQLRSDLKILFMSGYTDNAIAHHGVLDPGVSLLQKPFGPTALAQKVRQVLDS